MREFDRFEAKIARKLSQTETAEGRLLETVVGIAENIPKSVWINSLFSGPRTNTEDKALNVGHSALDARVREMIDEPLAELARLNLLRDDTDRQLIVDWVRIVVQAISVVRHPGSHTRAQRRQLISTFLLSSVLKRSN